MNGLMRIPRSRAPSLVPLIDVLFILLIYFMVTSVYLDLDMIPAGSRADDAATDLPDVGEAAATGSILVRIDRTGRAVINGQPIADGGLADALRTEAERRAGEASVLLMPSPYAPMQALVTAMDAVAQTGIQRSRVLQLEASEP